MVEQFEEEPLYPFPEIEELGEAEINLHFDEHIHNPFVGAFRSPDHAHQIAQFILETSEDPELQQHVRAFSVLQQDVLEASDPTFFDQLYSWEATVRHVTPWTIEMLLQIQANLFVNGFFDDTNLAEQRGEILNTIPRAFDTPGNSLHLIGKTVAGLELSSEHFWPLLQVNQNRALQFLEDVTEEFGDRWYRTRILFSQPERDDTKLYHERLQQEQRDILNRYTRMLRSFIRSLPKEEQKQLYQVVRQAQKTLARRNLEAVRASFKASMGERIQHLRQNTPLSRIFGPRNHHPSQP